MLTLHHLEASRSHRILWLLEEMDFEYELKKYKRDSETKLAPPELTKIHPLGKSPVLTDNDLVLAESAAILEYLLDIKPENEFHPKPGTEAFRHFRFFMHFAEGSMMPPLLVRLIFNKLTEPPVPFFIRPLTKMIANQVNQAYTGPTMDKQFQFIEDQLGKFEYLCGDQFTAADIQMSYPILVGLDRSENPERFPNLQAYADRISMRPAYVKAEEKGGHPIKG